MTRGNPSPLIEIDCVLWRNDDFQIAASARVRLVFDRCATDDAIG